MSPQPFFNRGETLRCIRFWDTRGREHEGILLEDFCTNTSIAYVEYFNWMITSIAFNLLSDGLRSAMDNKG